MTFVMNWSIVTKTASSGPLAPILDLTDEREDPLHIPAFIGPLQKNIKKPAELRGLHFKDKTIQKQKTTKIPYNTRRETRKKFLEECWGPGGHDPGEKVIDGN